MVTFGGPLAVRIDLDRVRRLLHQSKQFSDVRPVGSGGGPYKDNPWKHMAPYRCGLSLHGVEFAVGITGEGAPDKPSSSGARLFATAGPNAELPTV